MAEAGSGPNKGKKNEVARFSRPPNESVPLKLYLISGVEFERFAVDPRLAVRPLPMFTVTRVVKKARRRSLVGGPFAADDRRKEMLEERSAPQLVNEAARTCESEYERESGSRERRERERGKRRRVG